MAVILPWDNITAGLGGGGRISSGARYSPRIMLEKLSRRVAELQD